MVGQMKPCDMRLDFSPVMATIGLLLSTSAIAASPETCRDGAAIRMIQPLDFGDLALVKKVQAYVTVTANFDQLLPPKITALRLPHPGELVVCGTPHREIDIVITQQYLALRGSSGTPLASRVRDFTVAGQGISLMRISTGRWRGSMNETGRATVRIGATLDLAPHGSYGAALGEVDIEVFEQ